MTLLNFAVYGITGKLPVLTATTPYNKVFASRLPIEKFGEVIDTSRINLIDDELIMDTHITCNSSIDLLPCGHYNQVVNDRYAESVFKYLKENNVI